MVWSPGRCRAPKAGCVCGYQAGNRAAWPGILSFLLQLWVTCQACLDCVTSLRGVGNAPCMWPPGASVCRLLGCVGTSCLHRDGSVSRLKAEWLLVTDGAPHTLRAQMPKNEWYPEVTSPPYARWQLLSLPQPRGLPRSLLLIVSTTQIPGRETPGRLGSSSGSGVFPPAQQWLALPGGDSICVTTFLSQ